MACDHLKLVCGADGVLRCMDCGAELDRPEGLEKPLEQEEKKPAKWTVRKKAEA